MPVLVALGACQASVSGKANSAGDVETEPQVNAFDDLDSKAFNEAPTQSEAGERLTLSGSDAPALVGARHDVSLQEGQEASCRCLAVTVGAPHHPAFMWDGGAPRVNSREQLVVALSSHGIDCDSDQSETLGAAYRGFRAVDQDILVQVEVSKPGAPPVAGAIIPRPGPSGHVLVEPVGAKNPYGGPLSSKSGLCEVYSTVGSAEPTASSSATEVERPGQRSFTVVDVRREEQDQPSFEDIAAPEPAADDDSLSLRDSFYLSLVPSGAYTLLNVAGDGITMDVSGVGVAFDLYIGGAPIPDLAIGAVLGGSSVANPSATTTVDSNALTIGTLSSSTGELDGVYLNTGRVGAFADYYFSHENNFHALLELGAYNTFSSDSGASSSDADGFGGGLGIGYDWWLASHWSLGLLARISAAWLSDSSGWEYRLIQPTLGASLTFH